MGPGRPFTALNHSVEACSKLSASGSWYYYLAANSQQVMKQLADPNNLTLGHVLCLPLHHCGLQSMTHHRWYTFAWPTRNKTMQSVPLLNIEQYDA